MKSSITGVLLGNQRIILIGVLLLLLLVVGTGEVFAAEIPGGDIACEHQQAPIGGGDVGQVPDKATC